MKFLSLSVLCFVLPSSLSAQWRDESYALKGGWNAIYLYGDASYEDLTALLSSGEGTNIEEVWRWNSNPTAVQFTESPQIESPGTPEWSVWKRTDAATSTLSHLRGGFGYLVKCNGDSSQSYTVTIRQAPLVPSVQWVREGANLLGFQTPVSAPPTFSNFFEAFPSAIATGSNIYQYVGGDLSNSNPMQIFSTATESVSRNKAYWFESDVVSDFQGQVKVECSNADGLAFGDDGNVVRVTLRNRGTSEAQVTLSPVSSASAPANTKSIVDDVALMIREYDYNTLTWGSSPVGSSITRHVTAGSSLDLYFTIDRTDAAMVAAGKGDYFASLLKIEDAAGKMETYLPVSAEKGSLEGLWLGDVHLGSVESLTPGESGMTPTSSEMRLRMLLHVDEAGTTRLLSQAFVGILASSGIPGVVTDESLLDADYLDTSSRFVAAHMPLDQIVSSGSGTIGLGAELERVVSIPFNDPTNPFVHQYHPDHDNLDARFETIALPEGKTAFNATLSDGAEAPGIKRTCTFSFTAVDPETGTLPLGWGTTVLGGTYEEALEGVHKQALNVSGTFELRRITDIGTLTTP